MKLGRAHRHLQQLEKRADWFLGQVVRTLVEEPDPHAPGYYGAWVTAGDPGRDPFSLLIGDCLQCMRTALDQLAFELAASFTVPLPDQIAKLSEFPIFGNADGNGVRHFHAVHTKGGKLKGLPINPSGLAKIQGMHPYAQQVVECLQPYKRGAAYASDPLWVLHELNRIDKHRLLHPTIAFAGGMYLDPSKMRNISITPGSIQPIAGEIHGRTQVARWSIRPINPNEPIQTGYAPELNLAFADSVPLVAGQGIVETLQALSRYIVTDVISPLSRFLK